MMAVLPHQPGDPLAADLQAQPQAQLGVHPRRAVGAPRVVVDLADRAQQLCIG